MWSENIQTFHVPILHTSAKNKHKPKTLHFITYKSVSLFLFRSVYAQSFEHLNTVGVRATMEEQRSVIKFLLLEGEIPCHIFQRLQKCFLKPAFHSWVSQFREGSSDLASYNFYLFPELIKDSLETNMRPWWL